jgi:hypothetical protein
MDLNKVCLEDVDWIHLSEDRDCWQALMNTIMNPQVA